MPITILKTKSGQFRVRITAQNGEPLFHGEAVTTKQSAKKQIRALDREIFNALHSTSGCLEVIDRTGKEEKTIWV